MKQLRGVCRKDNWGAVNLTKDRSPEGGCKQRRFWDARTHDAALRQTS